MVFFCETKVVSRWFQIFQFETTFALRWFQAPLEVFFFLDKVSRPKKSQNLAQIHHMLGFKWLTGIIIQFIKYRHLIDNVETLYYIHKARISFLIALS